MLMSWFTTLPKDISENMLLSYVVPKTRYHSYLFCYNSRHGIDDFILDIVSHRGDVVSYVIPWDSHYSSINTFKIDSDPMHYRLTKDVVDFLIKKLRNETVECVDLIFGLDDSSRLIFCPSIKRCQSKVGCVLACVDDYDVIVSWVEHCLIQIYA